MATAPPAPPSAPSHDVAVPSDKPLPPAPIQTQAVSPVSPVSPSSPSPISPFKRATPKKTFTATGHDPITATLQLDPTLRHGLLHIPSQLTTVTDTALSSLERFPDTGKSFNLTTGAPVSGMARLAKSYLIPPDVRVTAENGNVTLRLGVVDSHAGGHAEHEAEDHKEPEGRSKGRVEVTTKRGGVYIEINQLDSNRQLDLHVETTKGDVFILLPRSYHGPIHTRVHGRPEFGHALAPQLAEVVNPYEDMWTTSVLPPGGPRKKGKFGGGGGMTHGLLKAVAKYVPEEFRPQDEYVDMAEDGYMGAGKGSQSKIVVKTAKGKVAFGYAGTRDAELAGRLGLVVGEGQRGKRWWN